MANMFALILVIATLVTGVLWCVDKFIFAPKRRERQAAAQVVPGGQFEEAPAQVAHAEQGDDERDAGIRREFGDLAADRQLERPRDKEHGRRLQQVDRIGDVAEPAANTGGAA